LPDRPRFSQEVYGGWMLMTLGVNYCLHLSLEKANGDVPECIAASRRWRRTLAVALGLLVAGMAVCATCYPQAMWYSVALASAVMLGMTGLSGAEKA